MGPASTFAITGVVKDQRGDAVGGEKLLHPEPLLHGFANAMTKQNRGPDGNAGRLDKDCVRMMGRAGNRVAGSALMHSRGDAAALRPAEGAVAKNHELTDARDRIRKRGAVRPTR